MSRALRMRVGVAVLGVVALTHCTSDGGPKGVLFSVRPLVRTAGASSACLFSVKGKDLEGTVPARPPVDGASCVVVGAAVVDESDIASASIAGAGAPAGTVNVRLDSAGAKVFDLYAAAHPGDRLAIMDQAVVVAAPTLALSSFHGNITFRTNDADATKFVAAVRRP